MFEYISSRNVLDVIDILVTWPLQHSSLSDNVPAQPLMSRNKEPCSLRNGHMGCNQSQLIGQE